MKRWTIWLLPTLVGATALLATGWLWQHERQVQTRELRRNFDVGLRQAATRVEQRMASYEQMLRGTRGLFDVAATVAPADFDRYVALLQAGADFAGLRAIGHATLQRNEATSVAPLSASITLAMVQLAPSPGPPLTEPGVDLLARPAVRTAMLQAGDAGNAVITPLLRPDPASGVPVADAVVLMFMPLYAPGRPMATVAERRTRLSGWVFAVFRMQDMVSSLYGEGTPGLDLHIHDGTNIGQDSLMFPPQPHTHDSVARFDAQEYIGVAGHTWTLWARSTPVFEHTPGQDTAQVIAVAGVGLAAALALLTWLLATARDRAHQAAVTMTGQLLDSERQYRRIVETASEGIWMVDAEDRTVFSNPALQTQLGSNGAALAGRRWTDFMDDAGRRAVQRLGSGQAVEHIDVTFARADGSPLWASVSVSRIADAPGQRAGLLAMVTDVGDRHRVEQQRALLEGQLRQSQKMEAIGTLAGGIAHDFNNILAAILGNVALLRQDLADSHPALAQLAQITQAGSRARRLVEQIAAFSRRRPQDLVAQPLRPLLEETVQLLRTTLPARVALVLHLSPEPLLVAADATQLQQVLMNLCTNAWHALPAGAGRIDIGLELHAIDRAVAQRLAGLSAGAHAHIWVRDNGHGMDELTRQRIFEPFFTTKAVGQGTGLGLAVAHGIVAAHGGAIDVQSAPGQGTCFDIYLPLASADTPTPRPEPAAAAAPQGQGQHVLYVDDDPVVVLMVDALLQRQGWRVSCLQDAQAALQRVLASEDPVDVVVTDYNMPGMSGLQLAEALAAARPALPVVITSGYITDHLRADARRAGVRSVLHKEYTLEQLGSLLHQLLTDTAQPPGQAPAATG